MVLGTFVATFIYSILVLNSVNAVEGEFFIPSLSRSVANLLSLMSLAFLIYYIHSVSESIQAQHIISRGRADLDKVVTRIFPQKIDHEQQTSSGSAERVYDIPTTCDRDACFVKTEKSGYLQAVDNEALMRIAIDADLLIHLGHRPGRFITSGCTLVTIWPGHKVNSDLSQKINAIFIVGPERTLEQDVEFAISQLVEIAVRALSPGINDPITAITCIDWLGAVLCQLADCKMPASHRFDEHNRLRIICKPFTFEGMVDAAFNMIRQHATTSAAVSIHLLETITTIAARARSDDQRAALLRHATMVVPGCEKQLPTDEDRGDLAARYDAAVKVHYSQKASSS